MKIYNSLSKEKEVFEPLISGKVGMYHCGPTVYDHVHVGNLRSFMLADFLRRTLEYLGYEVKQVMNITDVGHLVSDGDHGEDKMTKALVRAGKDITLNNMLAIARTYEDSFKQDLKALNILTPHVIPRASAHVAEDIEFIRKLEERGYTYTTSDGVYFDTEKYPEYGALGGINTDDGQSRIHENSEKKRPQDFALWKKDTNNGWKSPWGQGFPGWHIECSVMGMKYLGDQFDIHTGGSDLKSVHHNNEIAQSECCSGAAPFVKYWMHGEMLNFGGAKLSKSTGGNITLKVLEEKGYTPLAFRYLALQSHYRSHMNFSWEALDASGKSLRRIKQHMQVYQKDIHGKEGLVHKEYQQTFNDAVSDDLNLAQALALVHEVIGDDSLSPTEKFGTIQDFDRVLGLGLDKKEVVEIPKEVQDLLTQRAAARTNKDWEQSDTLRDLIKNHGFEVHDGAEGQQVSKL